MPQKAKERMAADGVAQRRGHTDQILALNASRNYLVRRPGRRHQTALAHRARLSGTQAGDWPRALRGAQMARLSPPRFYVHRGLRIPGLRKGDDSPLRTSYRRSVPRTYPSRQLPTQRIRPCGLRGTFQEMRPADIAAPLTKVAITNRMRTRWAEILQRQCVCRARDVADRCT